MRRRALVAALLAAAFPLVGCALIVDLSDSFSPSEPGADGGLRAADATTDSSTRPAPPNDSAASIDAAPEPVVFDCTSMGVGGWHTDCTFGNQGIAVVSTHALGPPVLVSRAASASMYIGTSGGSSGEMTAIFGVFDDGGGALPNLPSLIYRADEGLPADIGYAIADGVGDLVAVLTNQVQPDGASIPKTTFIVHGPTSLVSASIPIVQLGEDVETASRLLGFTVDPAGSGGNLGSVFVLTNLQMDGGPALGTVEEVTVNEYQEGGSSVLVQTNASVRGQNDLLPDGATADGDAGSDGAIDAGSAAAPRIEAATAGANGAGGFWLVGHDANSTDPDAGAARFLGVMTDAQPPAQSIPFVPDDALPILNTPLSFFVGRMDGQLVLGTLRVEQEIQAPIQVLPVPVDLVPTQARLLIPITNTPSVVIYGLTAAGAVAIHRFNFDANGVATLDATFGDGGSATVPLPYPAELGSVTILNSVYYASLRVHLPASEQGVLLRLSNQ